MIDGGERRDNSALFAKAKTLNRYRRYDQNPLPLFIKNPPMKRGFLYG